MKIELVNELVSVARRLTSIQQGVDEDDFAIWSYNDVYGCGIDDGKILQARDILDNIGIEWRESPT